ncbi:MAG: hypothetical protein JWM59_4490 [Verrucomicrobiales bacterium]|nr:hypothetical protein [Verrucomicrobiales bacterium]
MTAGGCGHLWKPGPARGNRGSSSQPQSRDFRAGIPLRFRYSRNVKFRPLALLFLISALTGPARPQASEPPLPGEDEPAAGGDFIPLLEPGDTLPADQQAPPDKKSAPLAPPELFPAESMDPEAANNLPGLVLPGDPIMPTTGLPGMPEEHPQDGLLPPPVDRNNLPLPPSPQMPSGMQLSTANAYWHKNPREARELAIKQQKPLLMLFRYEKKLAAPMVNGTAVADPALAMNDDLLSSDEFKSFASAHLVLTYLQYPVGAVSDRDYPPEKLKALQNFKTWFKAKLPCLILLDENGKEIERISRYSRIKGRDGKEYSAAGPIMDRLKLAVHRREMVIASNKARLEDLRAQNYREWTSRKGSKLMAKMVQATPERIVLMDEGGTWFRVHPRQLNILDRAWIQRNPSGKIPKLASSPAANELSKPAPAPATALDAVPLLPSGSSYGRTGP